ncbi:HET-domain-containing protein, partial [Setomelanomma holmii]
MADSNRAHSWMAECTSCHGDACAPGDSTRLHNFQVIDCETRRVTSGPTPCAYVALSYVWGSRSKDDAEYIFPNLPERLPATIEDAIVVTKRLGYQYIWIDRYCINQNDPDDKMRQILQMGAIYAAAQVTIVAASGDGPQHGLPGVRQPRDVSTPYGEVVRSVALVLTSVAAGYSVFDSPWASRAWTIQEGYLSRRRLFFTDRTMLYVCG